MKLSILVFILSSSIVMAGGDAHSAGHASDLIPPFVNILILASVLIWKLKDPVKGYFEQKSNQVSEVLERANVKSKEAEMMMKMQEEKAKGLENEIAKIQNEAHYSIEKFKTDYASEVEERVKKLKEDAIQKIEAEKKQMIDQVNGILLDQVIEKSKMMIKQDKQKNTKITANILQDLK